MDFDFMATLKDLVQLGLQSTEHPFEIHDLEINREQCYCYGSSVIGCHLP